ncbi:hypothetical protein J1N35_031193 [Gossypium stocksii]|uniref:Uncharacterized protein n=1 Tax=Gossypium stocksii TaxID=47602 RepID=A0A9D3V1H4_9ROSI|nr:hypothetical protein J1N35_031193 [Gossypium stocksii]
MDGEIKRLKSEPSSAKAVKSGGMLMVSSYPVDVPRSKEFKGGMPKRWTTSFGVSSNTFVLRSRRSSSRSDDAMCESATVKTWEIRLQFYPNMRTGRLDQNLGSLPSAKQCATICKKQKEIALLQDIDNDLGVLNHYS